MMKALWGMMIVTTVVILIIFFYAFIIMTSEQAVRISDEVETVVPPTPQKVVSKEVSLMPEDQGDNLQDPVVYAFNKDDPATLHNLALQYKGMDNLDVMDNYLKEGEYIPILKRLWTENDHERRYNWLEEKRSQSHPLLLFELALDNIRQDPTLKGFASSLYLIEFAKDRTEMDTACVTDNSADDAARSLYQIYAKALANFVKKNPGLDAELQKAPKEELSKEILEQLLAALKETQANLDKLPSPNWTSQHALRVLFSDKNVMVEAKTCQQKRELVLNALISKTELQLQEASKGQPQAK